MIIDGARLDKDTVSDIHDTFCYNRAMVEQVIDWLRPYLLAIALVLIAPVAKAVINFIFKRILLAVAKKTRQGLDDEMLGAAAGPVAWSGFFTLLYFALRSLDLSDKMAHGVYTAFIMVLGLAGTWLLFRWTDAVCAVLQARSQDTPSRLDDQLLPIVQKSLKIFIALVAVVVILQNLGYNISGLVAGLGIGGLAFALAAQETLSNLFGSLMIFLDRPFEVGDYIEVSSIAGTVEDVGFRSTRVRTLEKSLVSIPNSSIAKSPIDNYSRRDLRRVKMTVGLTYDTTPEGIQRAIEIIRSVLDSHERVDNDGTFVSFNSFGDSALGVWIQYLIKTTDWGEYLSTIEDVNMGILTEFNSEGLQFAFPTQTIHMVKSTP